MPRRVAARKAFYETIGTEIASRVVISDDGLTLNGFFPEKDVLILLTAYRNYLAIIANEDSGTPQYIV